MSFSELRMSESESTAADTISTRSITSYQSSRSGLTRQGSTFRPLKDDKKRGKSKSKGKKAGTVTGIPRHVQKELGLDRAAWIASQFTDAQLSNGGVSISTVIPTLDSISIASVPDGAITQLQNMNRLQAVTEDQPQLPPQEGQQDDTSLLRHLLHQSFDPECPNSQASPWMTTSGTSPSSPVMYVSPEATYMSKIIPNAVLPPSVDVVELSRNRSHSSVRMVSKSSLASASPAPSRASSRASSRFSSRAPSVMSSRISSRAFTHRTATLSESSGWSCSGSSETLVSDSSTISSSSTPRVASRTSQAEETDGPSRTPSPPMIPLPPPLFPPPLEAVPTPPNQTLPDVSSEQAEITSTPSNIPPPPPLPTDLKKVVKAITADKQEKPPPLPTTHTGATAEESPTPMVTPSLLQNVRLRSIRSNVNQTETNGGLRKPKHQTNQDTPQNPIRRSLILVSPDLPSQSATNQKEDTLPTTSVWENPSTTPPSDTQPETEPKSRIEQVSLDVKLEPNSQVHITDQKTQQANTEPVKESVSAETVPQIPNKAEPEPKITVQEIQNATPEPSTTLTPAEPKDQSIANEVKEIQNDAVKTEDKQSPQPQQDVKLPKPQTLIATSKFNPAQKVPPASISSSISLQEAIRLKTTAISSTDNQATCLSLLHSPPLSPGAISQTSTANFIFSKSQKKVVIEKSPLSPESKPDLRKTLVHELNSVSQTFKPAADPRNTKAKVPPPVVKKPSAKSEKITHNSSECHVDTEHVQTAGQ
ncbi:uncharacterized protein KIAA1522 homolog [Neoarius graeffei]|uniref:uncharacterized protein KIAA1522 homolog n=1 Tax=Neoarius graeffei TaxID=443677 RepID=UPI00298CE500|nr:uncharacterized protein KIAA1522 homolog [Neoarius graeffei]